MPMATMTTTGRVRPFSAVAAPGRPKSGYRARIDSKFVVDTEWDSTVYSSPKMVSTRRRPQSAPTYRRYARFVGYKETYKIIAVKLLLKEHP